MATSRSSRVSLHYRRVCKVHDGPRICVVTVLRGLAPGCFWLRQVTHRVRVHYMKNPGCAVQLGFDYRLRELGVVGAPAGFELVEPFNRAPRSRVKAHQFRPELLPQDIKNAQKPT